MFLKSLNIWHLRQQEGLGLGFAKGTRMLACMILMVFAGLGFWELRCSFGDAILPWSLWGGGIVSQQFPFFIKTIQINLRLTSSRQQKTAWKVMIWMKPGNTVNLILLSSEEDRGLASLCSDLVLCQPELLSTGQLQGFNSAEARKGFWKLGKYLVNAGWV